jgi:hypothetical protein
VKATLARLLWPAAVGLSVGEREITLSEVLALPLGPVQTACQSAIYDPEEPGEFERELQGLLAPYLARRGRLTLALGLPALRVFFSTRPVRSVKAESAPRNLLFEALQSPVNLDDMAVDVRKWQPAQRGAVSIVSCRKKFLSQVLDALPRDRTRVTRAEPSPFALLRLASFKHRPPSRSRPVLRAFLGDGEGLAVVAVGNSPVMWRTFDLPAEQEVQAIHSVVRALQVLLKASGLDGSMEAVLVHGRGPLLDPEKTEAFQEELGVKVLWYDGPGLGEEIIAFGVALGALSAHQSEPDLARELKPAPRVRDIFPIREAVLQLGLLVALTVVLWFRFDGLRDEHEAARAENASRAWAQSLADADLIKEKRELEAKVEAIRNVVGDRILWSNYTHDVAERLPAMVTLDSLQAQSTMDGNAGEGKAKRSFVFRGTAPVGTGGLLPPEVGEFVAALRKHPQLRKDFPLVELNDIRAAQKDLKASPTTSFAVTCLPNVTVAAPRAGKGGAKK